MKNNTTNYTIKATQKEIIITKKFEKAANIIGSSAYNELVRLMKDFSSLAIRVKEVDKGDKKKTYKGLTIEEMRRFVSTQSEEEVILFERVIAIANHKKGSYAITKKWFLNKYKEAYEKELEALKIEEELNQLEELDDMEEAA